MDKNIPVPVVLCYRDFFEFAETAIRSVRLREIDAVNVIPVVDANSIHGTLTRRIARLALSFIRDGTVHLYRVFIGEYIVGPDGRRFSGPDPKDVDEKSGQFENVFRTFFGSSQSGVTVRAILPAIDWSNIVDGAIPDEIVSAPSGVPTWNISAWIRLRSFDTERISGPHALRPRGYDHRVQIGEISDPDNQFSSRIEFSPPLFSDLTDDIAFLDLADFLGSGIARLEFPQWGTVDIVARRFASPMVFDKYIHAVATDPGSNSVLCGSLPPGPEYSDLIKIDSDYIGESVDCTICRELIGLRTLEDHISGD